MLTRLLVSHLLVNIAYIKIWVHLTFVNTVNKWRISPAASASIYSVGVGRFASLSRFAGSEELQALNAYIF